MNLKKLLNLTSALLCGILLWSCQDENKILTENEYPMALTSFIKTHFPTLKIVRIEREKELNSTSYDAYLEGNIKLEFDEKETITKIDGGTTALPTSVLPAKILSYVGSNYANQVITKWELHQKKHEVELANGTDLIFDADGNFIKIDKF